MVTLTRRTSIQGRLSMQVRKLITFICLSLLISVSTAQAGIKKLALIKRTSDNVKSELILETDNKHDIVKVIFKIFDEKGKLDREVQATPNELPDGVAVLTKMGVKVITLFSDNLAKHNGGDVTIRFLSKYKLIGKSKYGKFNVVLDRIGDDWTLMKNGVPFKELLAHDHSKGITKFEIIK